MWGSIVCVCVCVGGEGEEAQEILFFWGRRGLNVGVSIVCMRAR